MRKRLLTLCLGGISCFLLGFGLCLAVDSFRGSSRSGASPQRLESSSGKEAHVQEEAESGTVGPEIGGEGQTVTQIPGEIVRTEDRKYTYQQMVIDLQAMEKYFQGKIQVQVLGITADGREILEAVLGSLDAPRHLLIQSSIHGREYMNTQLAMKQLEEFLRGYETGSYQGVPYEELLDGLCLHVIPMANPDGVAISQSGLEGVQSEECRQAVAQCFRQDLEDGMNQEDYWAAWKANARGVDLNRNFDVGWEEYRGCSHPSSERYKGESPASEAETQAILQIQQEYPVEGCIAYHSSGNLVYWDYGSQGEVWEADQGLAQMVCGVTGYPLHSTVSDGTDLAGCSDYFVLKLGIPAVTIENGAGTCPLSAEEFPEIMDRNRQLLAAYLWHYQAL